MFKGIFQLIFCMRCKHCGKALDSHRDNMNQIWIDTDHTCIPKEDREEKKYGRG